MRYYLAMIGVLGLMSVCSGGLNKIDQSLLDSRGMTLHTGALYGEAINGEAFQFDAIRTFNGYQYAVYWVADYSLGKHPYHLAVARRKVGDSHWEIADLKDALFLNGIFRGKIEDAHDTASLGIDEIDGTIHLSYDMHDNDLNYRVSAPGVATHPKNVKWGPEVFGKRINHLGDSGVLHSVTYPMFLPTPKHDLELFIRLGVSGNGSNWIFDYDGKTHTWGKGRQIDDGTTGDYAFTDLAGKQRINKVRNSYPNGYNYSPDGRLFTTWVWRDGSPFGSGSNHDICFAYSDDAGFTWKNNSGQTITNVDGKDGLPRRITVNSPGIAVFPISQYFALMNTQAQAVDRRGQLHTLMYHRDPGTTFHSVWDPAQCSYYHSWRDAKGTWHTTVLSREVIGSSTGSRPRMVFDKHDNAYAILTVRVLSDANTNGIYFDHGKLQIAEATAKSGWSDWKIVASEDGPFVNEPLVDYGRAKEGVLSVMMQKTPTRSLQATDIVVYEYKMQ
ncbi:MAG TPA: BNR repeat-containing protein [Tepidisphaeraceae bacterium]|jgi:hypothetical protein